jgi:hypothetical protein
MSCKCGIRGKRNGGHDHCITDPSKKDAADKKIEKELICSYLKFR